MLATRLLHRFGSISRLSCASEAELRQVAYTGETWIETLLAVRQLLHDGVRERIVRTPVSGDLKPLLSYLRTTLGGLDEERMLAIFADKDGYIIAEEIIAEGKEGHVLVTPRKVLGRALKLDACRLLLAHNHPSGNPEPSVADIKQTRALAAQARPLGLHIEDHLIVGAHKVVSMKAKGLL